jgi:hypothetical protein
MVVIPESVKHLVRNETIRTNVNVTDNDLKLL